MIDRWEPARSRSGVETEESRQRRLERIADAMQRLRGSTETQPTASVVLPVNAQGDAENALTLLDDLARYDGPHTLEVILVVNNYPEGAEPPEIELFARLGCVVIGEPSVRRPGYAVPLMGRIRGMHSAQSDWILLFDADCRIPDPRALVDWYVAALATSPVGYSHVDFYDLPSHPSVRLRRLIHHGSRWTKRALLSLPTVRGSNYAVRRERFLAEFARGTIADDMNIGPVFRRAAESVAYSGAREHVVLTSGRMFAGGWRRLLSYAAYRLNYNLRVLPVRADAVRYTGKEKDSPRRYVDNRPVR
jgi:hypothetical protein